MDSVAKKKMLLERKREQIEAAVQSALGQTGDVQTLRVQLVGDHQITISAQVQLEKPIVSVPKLCEQKG